MVSRVRPLSPLVHASLDFYRPLGSALPQLAGLHRNLLTRALALSVTAINSTVEDAKHDSEKKTNLKRPYEYYHNIKHVSLFTFYTPQYDTTNKYLQVKPPESPRPPGRLQYAPTRDT